MHNDDELVTVIENHTPEYYKKLEALPNRVILHGHWRGKGYAIPTKTLNLNPAKIEAARKAREETNKLLGY